jgi:hypothetical protein
MVEQVDIHTPTHTFCRQFKHALIERTMGMKFELKVEERLCWLT